MLNIFCSFKCFIKAFKLSTDKNGFSSTFTNMKHGIISAKSAERAITEFNATQGQHMEISQKLSYNETEYNSSFFFSMIWKRVTFYFVV